MPFLVSDRMKRKNRPQNTGDYPSLAELLPGFFHHNSIDESVFFVNMINLGVLHDIYQMSFSVSINLHMYNW